MKAVGCVLAATVLAGTLGACADPYYPRYGYSQGYAYSTGPSVAVAYYPAATYTTTTTYPAGYTYYPSSYADRAATWDYYRNYKGIHPGPEYYP